MNVELPKKRKVLIVDDTPQNIQVLMGILDEHYAIIAARDGFKALDLAEKSPQPDIILLDIMMPEMDGYEVCRRLKANEKTRGIPVVFVSALADYEDEERGLAVGGIDYLTKPITPAIVLARVKNHIALREAQLTLESQNAELLKAAKLREDVEMITRHDLKSPLNVILAYPDLILMEGGLSDKQESALDKIQAAGYRMLDMINHSLDLYKMETGQYKLHAADVNLVDVFNSVVNECQGAASDKNIDIELFMGNERLDPDETFTIVGEEMLCLTLFSNLLKNAVEASPENEVVQISLDRSGEFGVVSIHNQGQVPIELMDRFFEKYVTCGKNNGTGLGTYSAKLSTEVQHGHIEMGSSETEGTRLIVSLPTKGQV